MRYLRAVEKLRLLADACQRATRLPIEEPFLRAAYVFGEVLDGVEPIESVRVAFALDLPPDEVPWRSQPQGTAWLVDSLRLDKGGFTYWWRSRHEPVWNHAIRGPVRIWSLDGPDEAVLAALRDRRFADLPRITASPAELRWRTHAELDRALGQLRAVHQKYWDRDWRHEHRGLGRYPENPLWEAADGYLDLLENAHRLGEEQDADGLSAE
ncbi:hypothetical protein F0L68_04695 [Solihabitans fulvus]|uniref:DUF7711 domain-containing protein n=1 Tax=Solihabitans fulvus TaxID=1892852 RepID=A0A5B2XRA2_9PSEU|nr:hypothetical protein [Solihabitans fulvus]KAA2265369.1 hypothetical protein F0L68_04695 [Solihabitans fulvus]